MEIGKCILCPKSATHRSSYCDTHFRVVNLQTRNYVLGRQTTILNPFSIFLYKNFSIRTFIEFPLRFGNVTYYLDLMFEYMNRIWVLEIDEHAHRSYDTEKDRRRTQALTSFGKDVNLVRMNPDKYYDFSRDATMPSVCERQVVFSRNYVTCTERKEVDLYVRKDELERRLGILFRIFQEAFRNNGQLVGEQLFEDRVVMRKLFY